MKWRDIKESDLQVDVYMMGGTVDGVTVKYLPTGSSASSSVYKTVTQNKERAIEILKEILYEME